MLTVAVDVDEMNTTALARAMSIIGRVAETVTFDGAELVAEWDIEHPSEWHVSEAVKAVTGTLAMHGHYVPSATFHASGFPV